MLNAIPIVGWLADFTFKVSLAIPFWFIWSVLGIGEKYFYFIPIVYQDPSFWDCVGIFIVVPILNDIFVPKLVSIRNEQKLDGDKDD